MVCSVKMEKYASGFEAILVMGITAIGMWLSWTVMFGSFRKK